MLFSCLVSKAHISIFVEIEHLLSVWNNTSWQQNIVPQNIFLVSVRCSPKCIMATSDVWNITKMDSVLQSWFVVVGGVGWCWADKVQASTTSLYSSHTSVYLLNCHRPFCKDYELFTTEDKQGMMRFVQSEILQLTN